MTLDSIRDGDPARRIRIRSGDVEAVVDPAAGGRIAALRVDGLDIILTEGMGIVGWGCYPMIPWAGRLGRGTFEFRGEQFALPVTEPPHAIHGTTLYQAWQVAEVATESVTLETELAPTWPFGGRAVHRVEVEPTSLRSTIEVHAERPMPVIVGWHPWFPRRLARGGDLRLEFDAGGMLLRGPDRLPTGEVVPVPSGPWDDAFVQVSAPPTIRWPGAIALEIRADVPVWVVYTEQPHAIAVEPQTGPPNGLRTGAVREVERDSPLIAEMVMAWRPDAGEGVSGG